MSIFGYEAFSDTKLPHWHEQNSSWNVQMCFFPWPECPSSNLKFILEVWALPTFFCTGAAAGTETDGCVSWVVDPMAASSLAILWPTMCDQALKGEPVQLDFLLGLSTRVLERIFSLM